MMITLFLICNSGASTRITQLYASTRKPEVITPAGFTGKAVTCHHEPAVNEYEYELKKKKNLQNKNTDSIKKMPEQFDSTLAKKQKKVLKKL